MKSVTLVLLSCLANILAAQGLTPTRLGCGSLGIQGLREDWTLLTNGIFARFHLAEVQYVVAIRDARHTYFGKRACLAYMSLSSGA